MLTAVLRFSAIEGVIFKMNKAVVTLYYRPESGRFNANFILIVTFSS